MKSQQDIEAKIATLNARMDALEKQMHQNRQTVLRLIDRSDINQLRLLYNEMQYQWNCALDYRQALTWCINSEVEL